MIRSRHRCAGRRLALLLALLVSSLVAADAASGSGARAARAPLVLVSFDGFRWDYAARTETPGLDALAARGVRAEHLVPVFPSKTFPGHYSIVTGLVPGNHGIVSNNMRDPRWPEPFGLGDREQVQSGRWWGGEPIWAAAARQGLRSAVYFWPGSEAPVGGVQPDWWFPYDKGVSYEARVDAALDWLSLPADRAPALVALYFDEPDTSGHRLGPGAEGTLAAARRVDSILERLLDGLHGRGIEANVVVVSDHGMAANDAGRVIVLEEYVELAYEEVFELGAFVQIYPLPGREDAVFEALSGAHPNLRVWRREEIPDGLQLGASPRLAPIVASPDPGWEVIPRARVGGPIPGSHGQDPRHPDMHGIFYAAGPDLRQGVVLSTLEQVDVYELLARLLAIDPAPNDGDPARTAGLLRARH